MHHLWETVGSYRGSRSEEPLRIDRVVDALIQD